MINMKSYIFIFILLHFFYFSPDLGKEHHQKTRHRQKQNISHKVLEVNLEECSQQSEDSPVKNTMSAKRKK